MPDGLQGAAVSGFAKAPFWNRLGAYILDALIGAAGYLPGLIIFIMAGSFGSAALWIIGLILLIPGFAWGLVYYLIKDGWHEGQNIGKKAAGLMVVSLDTKEPCTMGKSALRNIVLLGLNMIPYVGWLVEPVVLLAHEKGQRLGDLVANTQVISAGQYEKK